MHLTPQHMSDIYATLKAAGSVNGGGSEKRRATRLHVQGRINLWQAADFPHTLPHTVLTHDISLSGICLFQGFPLAPQEEFVIELRRQKHTPIFMLAKVQFISQAAENLFYTGAEFIQILDKNTKAQPAAPEATIEIPEGTCEGTFEAAPPRRPPQNP